jgi:hypothetical protein
VKPTAPPEFQLENMYNLEFLTCNWTNLEEPHIMGCARFDVKSLELCEAISVWNLSPSGRKATVMTP